MTPQNAEVGKGPVMVEILGHNSTMMPVITTLDDDSSFVVFLVATPKMPARA